MQTSGATLRDLKGIVFKSEFLPGTRGIFPVSPEDLRTYSEPNLELISKITEYVLTFDLEGANEDTS